MIGDNRHQGELIDTQWDVNTVTYGEIIIAAFELIDTQWDVNDNHTWEMPINNIRINRYIVGCKS